MTSEDETPQTVDEPPRKADGARVTNRDLYDLMRAVNDRCGATDSRFDSLLEHMDDRFDSEAADLQDLRKVTNDRLHGFEGRADDLEKRLRPIERGFNFKTALLQGSWKLTGMMIMATGLLTGIVAHYGLYTQFWHWAH